MGPEGCLPPRRLGERATRALACRIEYLSICDKQAGLVWRVAREKGNMKVVCIRVLPVGEGCQGRENKISEQRAPPDRAGTDG